MNLEPCPRCGRAPVLKQDFKYAWDDPHTSESIILLKYECRRWFRHCFGVDWHWIAKGWRDVGLKEAARKWNDACHLFSQVVK